MPGKTKAKRSERDFYSTPKPLTRRALAQWKPRGFHPATILEPAAGDGAMLEALRERFPGAKVTATDIKPLNDKVKRSDFLLSDDGKKYDLIITNPPFSHALEFIEWGLQKLTPGGYLVLLLRVQFLASRRRARRLYSRPGRVPEEVIIIPDRPSFRGGGTDWSDYAWYVWKQGSKRRTFKGSWLR